MKIYLCKAYACVLCGVYVCGVCVCAQEETFGCRLGRNLYLFKME